jgi:hypothetical protein
LNFALLLLISFAALLLPLLVWVLRGPRQLAKRDDGLRSKEDFGRRHMTYFPQVRQAFAAEDFAFLSSRGSRELTWRVRRERQKIALVYLGFLRGDFLRLWKLARVTASLSPQVGVAQEFARLRLGLAFYLRYEMVRLKFIFGFAPLPALGSLSELVSGLALRLETTMKELGERSAAAAKLASSLDGRGADAS